MQKRPPFKFTKPYDLRDRLFEYACAVVFTVQYLHTKNDVARTLGDQILRAGNSAGANYEEALFRLRVVRATGYLGPEYDEIIHETLELKRIMAALVRKKTVNKPREQP